MIGRQYYLTTLAGLRLHSARIAELHFVVANLAGKEGPAEEVVVFALVSADEATHAVLEHDAEFEALPHPLARTPISERVAAALASFGVASGDDTFTVAEKLARVHPLLRHRAF